MNENQDINLEELENSENEILERIAKRVSNNFSESAHGSHNTHGSSSHTSSS